MQKASARLLSLLSLLQARRDWPGPRLAERLNISPRTVRRDVDPPARTRLSRSLPSKDQTGGTDSKPARSCLHCCSTTSRPSPSPSPQIATTSGAGIEEAAARALNTIRQVMPSRLRHRIDVLPVTAVERPAMRPDEQVDSGVLTALGAAAHAREVPRFDYAPASPPYSSDDDSAASPARRVQPHHLVMWSGRCYLLAWDLDRDDWRTFRADRITPRTPTGPRFTPRHLPGGNVAAFVTGRFQGSDGPGGWPCRGEVILDLPAAVLVRYAREGIVEELGPDRCRLILGSCSWPGLAAAIGRFDADIEVVGPIELKSAFAHPGPALRQRGDRRKPPHVLTLT